MPTPLLIAVAFGTAATLLMIGVFRPNRNSLLRERIEKLGVVSEIDEYDESFHERVIAPSLAWLGRASRALLPSRVPLTVATMLREAGWSTPPGRFIWIWLGSGGGLFALMLLILLPAAAPLVAVGLSLVVGGVGLYLPWMLLRRAARGRGQMIDRQLPDAIDLIVTCVESGLGLQAAMLKVADHFDGPVADEFNRASRDVAMGRPRDEALHAMAERSGSRELKLLVRAIVQAEQMGVSIGHVLRNQSGELRERRRQRAREKANMVPVKMTIPTVLFIFPTLFLLMLGPVALQMMEFFGGE
jgi:tight adherence protein C